MKVLIAGASGFIGSHLADALEAAGHEVIELSRRAHAAGERARIVADFSRDIDPEQWVPRLQGIDCVVNAVGILRERGTQTFALLHADAPKALFSACARAGVRRVIQISALGAEAGAKSRYHRSKAAADVYLASLPLQWIVLQPSLVFGPGGASARLFATLAGAPLIALPGRGAQRVQPVHVADLAELCVRLVGAAQWERQTLAVVGPEVFTLRGLLARLRLGMGLGEPRFVSVSMSSVRAFARLAGFFPGLPLDAETLGMLERGSVAPGERFAALLGTAPRPVVARESAGSAGRVDPAADWARLNWLLPLLRLSVALVWILTGILSLGVYPAADSYALLARVGVHGAAAPLLLYGAATIDLALGIAVLAWRRRIWLWRLQMAVIAGYMAIITVALPEYWLHPFGPVLKNLPLLALILALHELERRA